ncbi:MAG: U32 family peptidase [Bacteroidales bacterium]|jgi:putative protease|nr:U32 family peptidase [Bacteroidales bacterium]
MVELLSPAGNKDIAIAAVNCGADAVYIGAPRFGARIAAGNSIADIEKVCSYAHRFNVKVYAALNTLLNVDELEDARRIAFELYQAGCDAIIVQDMTFLEMDLPPVPLHASTQCDNNTLEKILYLQQCGVRRVVLPREFSLSQIKAVAAATNEAAGIHTTKIELEAFIHGALCVCYSGKCYMSEHLTGRSANRGECSQPCRSRYNLISSDGSVILKNKHLLSLKDLSLSEYIDQLANAGVMSFKIEGRLKDIDYVKNVTAFYRKRIDLMGLDRTSDGITTLNFIPQLDKTFSRGFTTYFFTESTKTSHASFDKSSSIGEKIGTVIKVEKNIHIKTLSGIALKNGDGIVVTSGGSGNINVNSNANNGSYINSVEVKNNISVCTLQSPINADVGDNVFRTFDIEFSKKINKENYAARKISVSITLNNDNFSITDKRGNTAFLSVSGNFEKAMNLNKAKENIIKQLSRSGNEEIFTAEKINFETSEIPFIPLSEINNIRRKLFEKLENVRKSESQHKYSTSINIPNEQSPYTSQTGKDTPLMTTRYCILQEIGQCKKSYLKQPLYLENNGKRFLLKFNCNAKPCGMEIYR